MSVSEEYIYTNRELDQWILRSAQGDRDALEQLYRAAAPAVYAYALSMLHSRYDAEDVLHDCFLTVQTGVGKYRSQGKPMAWLMTVTRNLCLKRMRIQNRTLPLTEEDFFGHPDPDPQDRLIIESCLRSLSEEEQQIVILHAVAGFTNREIGQFLGLKAATVLTKYHRAIKKLRAIL